MTISIVTYHTDLDELESCLRSIHGSDAASRIWVVDNGSERRIERFCAAYPKVEYVASANIGYGAAHNIAMRRVLDTGSDYHLVLNSDVRFEPSVLQRLADYMDSHPDVGIVQPRVVYPDGSHQATARLLPTPLDVAGRRFLPAGWMRRRNARYTLAGISDSRDVDVPYLQGSFMMIRVEALHRVGLFDERFFMYPEDIDLCRRMYPHFRLVRHPAATIVHDHRAGSYHSLRLLRIHVVNMIRYFNKWGWWHDPVRRAINKSTKL